MASLQGEPGRFAAAQRGLHARKCRVRQTIYLLQVLPARTGIRPVT